MRVFLIVFQVIYVLALIPWLLVTAMSPMLFDAGVTAVGISVIVILLSYPIAVLICSIIAWRLRRRRKLVSVLVNLIPLLWVIAIPSAMLGQALTNAVSVG
ncbi:hypothetical protein JZ785_24525 [Alicyclobacillus curvatus]|nr:hypothetical protein JZ785_24525 [Alicyclobacillus curvatus]